MNLLEAIKVLTSDDVGIVDDLGQFTVEHHDREYALEEAKRVLKEHSTMFADLQPDEAAKRRQRLINAAIKRVVAEIDDGIARDKSWR
jgi:hypothetical protein